MADQQTPTRQELAAALLTKAADSLKQREAQSGSFPPDDLRTLAAVVQLLAPELRGTEALARFVAVLKAEIGETIAERTMTPSHSEALAQALVMIREAESVAS